MALFLKQWHYSPNKHTEFALDGHFTGRGAAEKFISKVNSTTQKNFSIATISVTMVFYHLHRE